MWILRFYCPYSYCSETFVEQFRSLISQYHCGYWRWECRRGYAKGSLTLLWQDLLYMQWLQHSLKGSPTCCSHSATASSQWGVIWMFIHISLLNFLKWKYLHPKSTLIYPYQLHKAMIIGLVTRRLIIFVQITFHSLLSACVLFSQIVGFHTQTYTQKSMCLCCYFHGCLMRVRK